MAELLTMLEKNLPHLQLDELQMRTPSGPVGRGQCGKEAIGLFVRTRLRILHGRRSGQHNENGTRVQYRLKSGRHPSLFVFNRQGSDIHDKSDPLLDGAQTTVAHSHAWVHGLAFGQMHSPVQKVQAHAGITSAWADHKVLQPVGAMADE